MTLLSKLTLSSSQKSTKGDSLSRKKDKIIGRLNLQLEMAKAFVEEKEFTAYKEKWQRDPVTKEQVKKRIIKKISKMWFVRNNMYFLEIRYGSKTLELAKNQHSIEVGKKENLVPTLETIIEAISQGELDEQLKSITSPLSKKK